MTKQQERVRFNRDDAPALAGKEVLRASSVARSKRFAYFENSERFVVVAGAQEEHDVDLALAHGMTHRGDRKLVLVLPRQHAFATLQRAPWFASEAQPEVWLHDGARATRQALPSQGDTVKQLKKRLQPRQTSAAELADASTPIHLGHLSATVHELVEWATKHQQLDPGHRQAERSWQSNGLKVLSIKRSGGGLVIRAGIHYTKAEQAPRPFTVPKSGQLDPTTIDEIKRLVLAGVHARSEGTDVIHRADEHWLQSVIRRDPSLVGVEQPALREVPAWRPRGSVDDASTMWGRGFIDLLGVDGHGDIRIVETKIADNQDDLLILQGLDYFIWAQHYKEALLSRLGAASEANLEVHYVVGADRDGNAPLSQFAPALANNLDASIAWRFQIVRNWYPENGQPKPVESELFPARTLPS